MQPRGPLLAALLVAAADEAAAGAWTRAEGAVFTSQTIRYFSTEPSASREVDFAKAALDIYAEYGLAEGFTLGIEADQGLRLDNAGHGQIDGRVRGFARIGLWRGASGDVAALEFGGSIPSSDFSTPAAPGGDASRELRLAALYGRGFAAMGGHGWLDATLSFGKFFGDRADEVKLDLTAGFRPDGDWLAMAQLFATKGLGNEAFGGVDYDLAKLKLSAGRRLDEERTLLLGVSKDLYARGTSPGYEVSLTLWSAF